MEAAEAEGLADDLVELSLGDTVRCGRFSLTVLWPERLADDGGNADSLCLLAFWDGDGDGAAEWTALFTAMPRPSSWVSCPTGCQPAVWTC